MYGILHFEPSSDIMRFKFWKIRELVCSNWLMFSICIRMHQLRSRSVTYISTYKLITTAAVSFVTWIQYGVHDLAASFEELWNYQWPTQCPENQR